MRSTPGIVWQGSVAKIQSLSYKKGVYHDEVVLG
jgi:hypothetical protein